jgi:parallel beta-helix repeat protein
LKRKNLLLSLALIVIILSSAFVGYQTLKVKPPMLQNENKDSPFYLGIEFGYGNASDCKLLVDKVKNYTNLLVISSTNITQNEPLLNETCDYAFNAGLHLAIYFPQSSYYGSSSPPYIWAMKAKEKYGQYFLGSYVYDEVGGEVLDRASGAVSIYPSSNYGGTASSGSDYKSITTNFVTNARNQMDSFLYCAKKAGTSVMTADYGLYWFDYKAGYDTVLAEFGWGNDRQMAIALCRGAATAQNKDWGAIICWEAHTNGTGRMENGAALYQDLVLAYDNGAKYGVVFDYSGKNSTFNQDLPNPYPYGILTDEHFSALENFWSYIQQNPDKHGSIKADSVLVLPQYYGFGFRRADDKIWGMDQADSWTVKMWNDANNLLSEREGSLDIVYSDTEFQDTISKSYDELIHWTSGATSGNYSVINLNSTLGYSSIQKAVSSGATVSGDVIVVKAGTYQENVVITKPISLQGENKETTTIDARNKGSAITVTAPNVTIQGFKLENANSQPIQITDLNSNSTEAATQILLQLGFDPNQISSLDPVSAQALVTQYLQSFLSSGFQPITAGICLSNADNCTLTDNFITSSTNGIILASSANTTMQGNTLVDNMYSFGIGVSTQTIINGNDFAPAQYDQNIDNSNTVNGKPIYYWTNQKDSIIPQDAGYVALVNCTNITVQNLQLSNNYNGLLIVNTDGSTITNNTLIDNYEGLRFSNSADNNFKNNNIRNSVFNLVDPTVPAGIDSSNTLGGKPIYVWINQHDKTVPTDAGYVALVNCSGIIVKDLNLTSNAVGILLQNTNNCTIINSTIRNMTTGLSLTASTGIVVSNNTLSACQDGIILENASTNNTITGNMISGNKNSGINMQTSTNTNIVNNKLTGNNQGITLLDSSDNTLKGNLVETNYYGIDFSAGAQMNGGEQESTCTRNIVIENNITQNTQGITVNYNVLSNTFYRNNFINNTQQAYSSSYNFYSSASQNSWDNGKQGNYWSNYNGTDINNDGVGDQSMDAYQQYQTIIANGTPQRFPVTSDVDHFPLMQPYPTSATKP